MLLQRVDVDGLEVGFRRDVKVVHERRAGRLGDVFRGRRCDKGCYFIDERRVGEHPPGDDLAGSRSLRRRRFLLRLFCDASLERRYVRQLLRQRTTSGRAAPQ